MEKNREHKITLRKSPSESIIEAVCDDCKWIMSEPTEYHPVAFCDLVKAGHNPFNLVRAATNRLPKPGVIELQEVRHGTS